MNNKSIYKAVYIVIPAYNEETRIANVLDNLLANSFSNIIVVDDESKDNTASLIKNNYPNIIYLKHFINRGQGTALRTGSLLAWQLGAKYIVHFDADGQMSVEDIKKAIEILENNEDIEIILGSRFLTNDNIGQKSEMPIKRRILLWGASIFSKYILNIDYSDPQNGFRVFRANILPKLWWNNDRMAHCSEILQVIKKNKLKYKEMPVNIIYTDETLEKGQKAKDAFKIVWDLFINKLL